MGTCRHSVVVTAGRRMAETCRHTAALTALGGVTMESNTDVSRHLVEAIRCSVHSEFAERVESLAEGVEDRCDVAWVRVGRDANVRASDIEALMHVARGVNPYEASLAAWHDKAPGTRLVVAMSPAVLRGMHFADDAGDVHYDDKDNRWARVHGADVIPCDAMARSGDHGAVAAVLGVLHPWRHFMETGGEVNIYNHGMRYAHVSADLRHDDFSGIAAEDLAFLLW